MLRSFTVTGEQIRAGRALARVEQTELARRSGLSLETIKRLERIRGPVDANTRTLHAINEAFHALGVELYSDEGVGMRSTGASARAVPAGFRNGEAGVFYRLSYSSTLSVSGDELRALLDELLHKAGAHNATLGVTGVVLISHGRCLQVLEGPKQAVQQVYGGISADGRHKDLQVIERRPTAHRQFGDWTIYCGVFPSDEALFRGEPAMADGFRPELLSPAAALGILSMACDLQKSPPRTLRNDVKSCPLAAECLDPVCARGVGHAAEQRRVA
jgi:transcriptional regulator with XRE-family HTH domain